MLDYFGKKIAMSRFTRFSEESFLLIKSEIWANSMGSDAIVLNFSKELARLHWMFHAGFREIRFLKWRDVISSNSWFLVILKGFYFTAFKLTFFFLKLKRIITNRLHGCKHKCTFCRMKHYWVWCDYFQILLLGTLSGMELTIYFQI